MFFSIQSIESSVSVISSIRLRGAFAAFGGRCMTNVALAPVPAADVLEDEDVAPSASAWYEASISSRECATPYGVR